MRGLMFALVCGAAMLFCAPQAWAQDEAPQAALEEAPVDVEAQNMYCAPRMGGPSARRGVRRCAANAIFDATPFFGAGTCAVRYAYRGHRRINYRPRACEPLFQRRATSAI